MIWGDLKVFLNKPIQFSTGFQFPPILDGEEEGVEVGEGRVEGEIE